MDVDAVSEITVLFVAHDGIVNPVVWEQWLSLVPNDCIVHVAVFVNADPRYANDLTLQHDLGIRVPTAWCSFGIVEATIESIAAVLALYENSHMIYVVSGACIPLKHPQVMLANHTSYFYKIPDKPSKAAISTNWLVRNWLEHRQFFSITSDDARILVQWYKNSKNASEINTMRDVHEKTKPVLTYTRQKVPVASSQPGALYNACADEWVIGTILKFLRRTPKNYQIVAQYYPPVKDTPSPVQFPSLDSQVQLDAGNNRSIEWSLREIVQEEGYTEVPYFLRKVALSEREQRELAAILTEGCWATEDTMSFQPHNLAELTRRVDYIESYLNDRTS